MLYDTIVIGAGAAGLFFAARRKAERPVLVLDRQERAGRKILLSGGGKCNVTNKLVSPDNYLGQNNIFTKSALAAFTPGDMLNLLRELRIASEEREHGQIFCRQGAEALRDALYAMGCASGADFRLGQQVKSARAVGPDAASAPEGARFIVETPSGAFFGQNLLLACGGPAWPKAGATFWGKQFARDFGHNYIAPRPALTPLKMPDDWPLHGLQGISVIACAAAPKGPAFTLPLLFTHAGLSGPACLQASSYLQEGEAIGIDFLPDQKFSALLDGAAKQNPLGILRRLLPERLAAALLSTAELAPFKERKNAELSRAARNALANAVHSHRATPLAPGFEQAESSTGGIDTAEIRPKTMESKLVPGLYFAGEVVDVCGQLGGYNLHWAWASAAAVARAVRP